MVSGFQHVYITNNGGNTWNEITSDIPAGFNKFQAPTNYIGYAVGPGGLILKYQDTTYTPVELFSFDANYTNNKVILNWRTATETNNRGFEIERQDVSRQLSVGNWKKIGYVQGKGTTTEPQSYSFNDKDITNRKYKYRLKQIDFNGTYKYSKEIAINISIPLKFSLSQNYPNPFNPSTNIGFTIPDFGFVTLKIYDVLGREVKTLVNEVKKPGEYKIKFNGSNLPSGVYFYSLKTEDFYQVRKMLLIK